MTLVPPNPDLPQGDKDTLWMQNALQLADAAQTRGEVPVGAIWVGDNKVISGSNKMIGSADASAHAEIVVLREAGKSQKNYRLGGTLYVTLEPCPMCAMAIVHARIERVVYGAVDARQGAMGSLYHFHNEPHFNHRLPVTSGILAQECEAQLQRFFAAKRG